MFSSLSSKIRSLVSINNSAETDVTSHRKRKRETSEWEKFDGEVEFVSEKKPKLESSSSQPTLLSNVFSSKNIKSMSDWVQHKIPSFNMFNWKPKPKKPPVTHGNGQGIHGHHRASGVRRGQDRAGSSSLTRPGETSLHRDALRAAYGNRGTLPLRTHQSNLSSGYHQRSLPLGSLQSSLSPGSQQSSLPPGSQQTSQSPRSDHTSISQGSFESSQPPGSQHTTEAPPGPYDSKQPPGFSQGRMVNGERLEEPLSRPPLHGSPPPSEHAESIASSSVAGSSQGSRKGVSSKLYRMMFNVKQEKFTAEDSVRLQDKVRYKQLLQQFTTVPLDQDSLAEAKPESIRQPICPTALPRFFFKSNDSILGSTSGKSLRLPEKQEMTARPRIKVHPSQRKTPQNKQEPQPFVNGDKLEDDSLLYINDISAIHDSRTTTVLPGSSHKISIDLTDDDDDVQIVSKHKHATDYRESKFITEDWIKDLTTQYGSKARERDRQIKEEEIKAKLFDERRKADEEELENRIRRQMQIYKKEPAVTEEIFVEEEEEEKEEELPELMPEMEAKISGWLHPQPAGQILVEKFRLQITRKDIATLAGLEWLNDEIINFYMNLLMERGEKDGNAKVYAFNTFFYPKILGGGQSAVKRWTRRVDIFAHDYLLIPVHLGMHWCLAVVSFKKKQIQYYDSMGGNNVQCLNVIKKYLCDECLEKKKQEFNLQGWSTVIVKDIPQQMNGSDCGMFACKYAEYITRGAPITFTQQHMPYFRRRMVYEIVTGKLLQ